MAIEGAPRSGSAGCRSVSVCAFCSEWLRVMDRTQYELSVLIASLKQLPNS